jgi:hypothetical protein
MTTIPTIHLNGTGKDTLTAEYYAAYKAIEAAVEALAAATSNCRDFYPQGADAYSRHRKERAEAFACLRQAQGYVEEVLDGICNQP